MQFSLKCFRLLVLGLFFMHPAIVQAGGAVLMKGGSMSLRDDRQTVDFTQLSFDGNSSRAFAFNVEGRKRNGVALGGEYISYHHDFSTPTAQTGTAETQLVQFLAKKYFIQGGPLHPYLGVGLGLGHTYINSGTAFVSDIEFTLAIQALVGIELRFDNLSFLAEVKHLYHDIESGGNEYNPTATGFFVGMGFNW